MKQIIGYRHLRSLALFVFAAVLASGFMTPASAYGHRHYSGGYGHHYAHARGHYAHAYHARRHYAFGRGHHRARNIEIGHGGGGAGGGIASVYSGGRTANGEHMNPGALTAAHPSLPFGTMVTVTNQNTGRSVVVRINDRGPFVHGRVIDLSPAAARAIGMNGLAHVALRVGR